MPEHRKDLTGTGGYIKGERRRNAYRTVCNGAGPFTPERKKAVCEIAELLLTHHFYAWVCRNMGAYGNCVMPDEIMRHYGQEDITWVMEVITGTPVWLRKVESTYTSAETVKKRDNTYYIAESSTCGTRWD